MSNAETGPSEVQIVIDDVMLKTHEIADRPIKLLCLNSHRNKSIQSEQFLPFLILEYTVRGNETSVDEYQLEQIYLRIKLTVS